MWYNWYYKRWISHYYALDHVCRYFEADDTTTYDVKECWYCRYADFRRSNEIMLENSVCRHILNRVKPIR